MPILNIQIMQGHTEAQKAALLESASRSVMDSLAAPLASVRIVLEETAPQHVMVGGRIGHPMALALVRLIQGRTEEKKAALIAALNQAIHATLGISKDDIRVVITDVPTTDMGVAGGLTAKAAGR
ncbi:tautomerase family protein [Bordetella genomosp. 13]|uniref:4-oxalocrotonate tautomerase n=1 Tax=Bordetella genomosp. 13 TaxID=463040 RepID=A0A1W6ZC31_9BORD|nr:tautomerase family protein [Bordetella genomosp. 13]ARP94857.1 4-oxalocrotonate tautomerase [Bordetella genomosp. 13]